MNKSKIIMYQGKRGAGKTLTMIKDGYKYHKSGWKVITNMESLKFGELMEGEDILKIDKDSDLYNCVIIFDEIQIYFDSRKYASKENKQFSNFIQQIRKRNIILLCTTQYTNSVEKRLRQHIDITAHPKFIQKYNICEVIYIDITSIEDDILSFIKEPEYITIVYNPLKVFKLYKTEEIIA